MRVSPAGQKVSWGTMEQAVRKYRPDSMLVSLKAMEGDRFAFRARVIDPSGRYAFVHVNQWTGEVNGISSPLTVQRFFRDLHRYLFMPNYIGLPIVSSMAFVLGISLYTGLKTTRKWRLMARRIRTHKGVRVTVGDLHKAAGLWSTWFLAVMIITGVWYLIEFGANVSTVLANPPPPLPGKSTQVLTPLSAVSAGADELISAAESAFPGLKATTIYFSQNGSKLVQVQGIFSNPLVRDRANKVLLDPIDANVVRVLRAEQMQWPAFLNEMADPLHFGYFGGLTTKLIWFTFGLCLSSLSLSGIWLTWRRLDSRSPSKIQLVTLPILIPITVAGYFWYERITGPDLSHIARKNAASDHMQSKSVVPVSD